MKQAELLHIQLEFALRHDGDIKLKHTDYPGYWLLIIEELLDQADRQLILNELRVTRIQASLLKVQFARYIAHLVAKDLSSYEAFLDVEEDEGL